MSSFQSTNILVVNSSVRGGLGQSSKLTEHVVHHYLQTRHNSFVKYINLGEEPYPYINNEWVIANTTSSEVRSEEQKVILSKSDNLIQILKNSDIVIFGCPMYNFSINASLKTYFDLICRVGHTFEYTSSGATGLLLDKKVVICTTSAGVPSGCGSDFVTGYMRQLCEFIGMSDLSIISANSQMSDLDSFSKALLEIKKL